MAAPQAGAAVARVAPAWQRPGESLLGGGHGLALAALLPAWAWCCRAGPADLAPPRQVAGYAASFEGGLTFATVKGAGHMVPQTSPEAALALLQAWLADEL